MAKIKSLLLKTVTEEKIITLIDSETAKRKRTHLTILTGRNGSHKSSILRQIAELLIDQAHREKITSMEFMDGPLDYENTFANGGGVASGSVFA
ncbi:hypothetical protein [Herbaspirillum huttiense]|uniref:hypothetical protein n=1 Tax=Herbaspirillum huttiense TaxID=863372 RepID=UPI0031E1CE72